MKPFEIHSDHDPETSLRLWDSKIVEFTSKNKGAYSGERCFFGTHEKNQLMVFFHSDYDTVYLSTRFMGTIEPDGTGSKISGVIGKMKSAIFFLWYRRHRHVVAAFMAAGNFALCTGHYCFLLREDHTEGLYCTTGEAFEPYLHTSG